MSPTLLFIILFIFGILLLYTTKNVDNTAKIIITIISIFLLLIGGFGIFTSFL